MLLKLTNLTCTPCNLFLLATCVTSVVYIIDHRDPHHGGVQSHGLIGLGKPFRLKGQRLYATRSPRSMSRCRTQGKV